MSPRRMMHNVEASGMSRTKNSSAGYSTKVKKGYVVAQLMSNRYNTTALADWCACLFGLRAGLEKKEPLFLYKMPADVAGLRK